jgi:hypothetical protein
MRRIRGIGAAVAALAIVATLASPASAQETLPNITAVGTDDHQVAVTFAGRGRQAQLDAGAFSTLLIQNYGMIPLANYEPQTNRNSMLICDIPYTEVEVIGVYGIRGQGAYEAYFMCQVFENAGYWVRWD